MKLQIIFIAFFYVSCFSSNKNSKDNDFTFTQENQSFVRNSNANLDSFILKSNITLLIKLPIDILDVEESGISDDFLLQDSTIQLYFGYKQEFLEFNLNQNKLVSTAKINKFLQDNYDKKIPVTMPFFVKKLKNGKFIAAYLKKVIIFDEKQNFEASIVFIKNINYVSAFKNGFIVWEGRNATHFDDRGNIIKSLALKNSFISSYETRFTQDSILYEGGISDSGKFIFGDSNYVKENINFPSNNFYSKYDDLYLYASTPSYLLWFSKKLGNQLVFTKKTNDSIVFSVLIDQNLTQFTSSFQGDETGGVRIIGYDDNTIYLSTTNINNTEEKKFFSIYKIIF
jgi:hypothetical protein